MRVFGLTEPEPMEGFKWCDCEQPDFHIRDSDSWRFTHCRKCDGFVLMPDMLNNILERIKKLENK